MFIEHEWISGDARRWWLADEAASRTLSVWRRLAAEFVVIVVGVLVALGVDAARDAHADRLREAAYLRQLQADLTETADHLAEAISVDRRARDGADGVTAALNASGLPPSDSLASWLTAATNSSAAFYPTMGTVTALVESGELRLVRDEDLRRRVLQYHSAVESALRIVDAVDPHMWRTLERLGGMLSWPALLQPEEAHRFPMDWGELASERAFHGALYDLRLAATNRLFALSSLSESLDSLLTALERRSR
jgi:hypothetical protein